MKKILLTLSILTTINFAYGNSYAEASSSGTHGKYLAGEGVIIPAKDVMEEGYIAQIDYNYPTPEHEDFGVYLYNGNKQVSNKGQDDIIQIGLKANKVDFDDLPPLNLSFVIDTSGSMGDDDKLNWVKESFEIFIQKVRDIDYVSLVSFDNDSEVILQSTLMDSELKRSLFRGAVKSMEAGGGTNLVAGIKNGYDQVLSTYREGYTNRVMFLTDGVGQSDGILEMAEEFKQLGINVSTIGVGKNFDLNLMVDLARTGGGSSRFINDREEMRKIFSSELDRMLVPAARNLKMSLEFPEWVEVVNTWGYNNKINENSIKYLSETLHNGDYETILAQIKIKPNQNQGLEKLAKFTVNYDSLDGKQKQIGPLFIEVNLVNDESVVDGISNYTVLKSSSMLYFSQSLKEVANIYYDTSENISKMNELRSIIWDEKNVNNTSTENINPEDEFRSITNDEIEAYEEEVYNSIKQAFNKTLDTRKRLLNTKAMLDNIGFEDEVYILDQYLDILGTELELDADSIANKKKGLDLDPRNSSLSFDEYMNNLFSEVKLSISSEKNINVAVSPFLNKDNLESKIVDVLHSSAIYTFSNNTDINVLDRSNIEKILEEQKLALSGLVDLSNAISVGELLSVNYIVTGNIIPMNNSVLIFARLINVETSEIESVSRVIVPKNDEIIGLL